MDLNTVYDVRVLYPHNISFVHQRATAQIWQYSIVVYT